MDRILDPLDRVSEVIFGLLMALTFTVSVNVATHGEKEVREMMFAALGCNLAWGLADAVIYLMRTVTERTRNRSLHARLQRAGPAGGRAALAKILPERLVTVIGDEVMEAMRQRVLAAPDKSLRRILDWDDFKAAGAIFVLVVLATFPVVIPFMVFDELRLAMLFSNGAGLVMLFIAGWLLAHHSGGRPWRFGAGLAIFGALLTAAIVALGG